MFLSLKLNKLKRLFMKEELSREAFEAYLNRLPHRVEVSWKRDNDFIIGEIVDNNHHYFTQGKNAENFIDMVNDAIYTYHEIPASYIDVIKKVKTYNPPLKAKKELENIEIKESLISLRKNKKVLANA